MEAESKFCITRRFEEREKYTLPLRCLHIHIFPGICVRRNQEDKDPSRRNRWSQAHIHIGHSDNRKSHNLYSIRIEDPMLA